MDHPSIGELVLAWSAWALQVYAPIPVSLAWIWIYWRIHQRIRHKLVLTCLLANVAALAIAIRSVLQYHGAVATSQQEAMYAGLWWFTPYIVETICVLVLVHAWLGGRLLPGSPIPAAAGREREERAEGDASRP